MLTLTPKPRRAALRAQLLTDGRRALKLANRMKIDEILLVVGGSRPRLYRAMRLAHATDGRDGVVMKQQADGALLLTAGAAPDRQRKPSPAQRKHRASDLADSQYRADDDWQGEEELARRTISEEARQKAKDELLS